MEKEDLEAADRFETVAETYEQLLVPALFGQWAAAVANSASVREGQRVLDVACGTGVLARTLAMRVGPEGIVAALDINPAMLAVARKKGAQAIEWREGPAEQLPYGDAQFDAVVSQFGLMLFPSPERALQEMMRVLVPGGRLAVAVFDSLDTLPAYAALADIYARVVAEEVGQALRSPFSLGDVDVLASCFADAGIADVVITSSEGTARFPDVGTMVAADVRGWFPFAQIRLDEQTVDVVTREAEEALAPFTGPDGTVEFPLPVHIASAVRA
ncbi:class I SAM-dependent methyltransferase [Marinobacter sp. DUT-1]|uniref:class I SAM-dependent methyltransferase n=1 Tax=Marinobacter sp. DUT-1 TaxID=3412037 RepID=UPI003D16362A